jgi:hypothetical protein
MTFLKDNATFQQVKKLAAKYIMVMQVISEI